MSKPLPPRPKAPGNALDEGFPEAPGGHARAVGQDTLTQPYVALPWAPPTPEGPEGPEASPQQDAQAQRFMDVPQNLLAVPDSDGPLPYALSTHLSLAVALDVLSTHLSRIVGPEEAQLAGITQALLAVCHNSPIAPPSQEGAAPAGEGATDDPPRGAHFAGPLEQEAQQTAQRLRAIALGPIGEARAAMVDKLASCTVALGEADFQGTGVALACRHLEAGSHEVVHRARLALEAQEARRATPRR